MKIFVLAVLLSATLYSVSGRKTLEGPEYQWCGGESNTEKDECCKKINCPSSGWISQGGLSILSWPCPCYNALYKCRRATSEYNPSHFRLAGNSNEYWPFQRRPTAQCYFHNIPDKCYTFQFLCNIFGNGINKPSKVQMVHPVSLTEL